MRFVTALFLVGMSVSLSQMLLAADPTASYSAAMSGDDFQAKRAAIQAVAGLSKDDDEYVLSFLVQAANDRQASEVAINALRARTGLQKPTGWTTKGSGYPGYPSSDTGAGWSAWLSGWKKDNDEKKKLAEVAKKAKDLEQKTKDLEKKADGKEKDKEGAATADGAETTTKTNKVHTVADGERGPRCRVHFKTGGSKVYVLLSKRVDADGNLISLRVAHPDGGGNEVLTADSIVRVEEDVK